MRQCQALIIWTDCDREGENIGYEIIDVCKAGELLSWICVFNRLISYLSLASLTQTLFSLLAKQNIQVFRARFSEITPGSIRRACESLTEPDINVSDAVDVRQELDLRIGKPDFTSPIFVCFVEIPSDDSGDSFDCFSRSRVYTVPDFTPSEDLPRVSVESADQLRELSVSHPGLCGGEV